MEKRYKEKPDKKIYTSQIMNLLDEYVIAGHITKTEAVNILDDEIFEQFIKRTDITVMDMANQIQDPIKDYIDIDPAFYQKFSTIIDNTIIQHHNKRLSDSDLLNRVKKIRAKFKNDVPSELSTNKTIIAFYRKALSFLQNRKDQNQRENAIQIALDTYDIIKQKIIVHWTKNTSILNEKFN
ncbi:type I restriction enzyme endonuclease domain-containing protein [Rickettsia conorii]|uniref:type I restriction enzyme endonuclease domain-containing protein n=1 Tax=Rickettsia conorii TaxID=781 RepID=UPI002B416E36|nr:type I restriction enzyme endonuclease domain-containing protein [Rickettsia conorii]